MAKYTLKILRCSHRKIFKVFLAILQHYAWKGYLENKIFSINPIIPSVNETARHMLKNLLAHAARFVACAWLFTWILVLNALTPTPWKHQKTLRFSDVYTG